MEKRYLFELIKNKFIELNNSEKIHGNKVRVRAIGRVEMLPADLQEEIARTEAATRNYERMYLNIALAYGGQRELRRCCAGAGSSDKGEKDQSARRE